MFYLGIDLHSRQFTVNNRNEEGAVVLRRQVSTKWDKAREFFERLRAESSAHGGFMAIVEVCGFEDWMLKLLAEYGCVRTVLVQSKDRAKRKTDRIDASKLSEMLWLNRLRLAAGERLQQLRQIESPSGEDAVARQLTALRMRLARDRTRTTNQVHRLLRKHNLTQACPTKSIRTVAARQWFAKLPLPEIDALERKLLLARWELWDQQLADVEKQLQKTQHTHRLGLLVNTIPGLGGYSGLGIGCRIGDIERFPRGESLANFWGLTPSCRNSGETKRRLGSITKEGSTIVRFLLGQAVYHVLRKCPLWRKWYLRVKNRRGSKIARVAVMRRLATTIWYMVKHNEPFRPDAGFGADNPQAESTRSSVGEGTSRARPEIKQSSLPPHPQPPSPLLCCSGEES
jgi:transposase